ncbi:MAG: ACT domain-containing protein [Syntrophobacterales bacterium]|jgi:aspartokinase
MTKIRLRGLKLLEGGAQVLSSGPGGGENLLAADICTPLALNKINLTFLTLLSPHKRASCVTSLCTEGSAGRAAASLIGTHHSGDLAVHLHEDVSTFSIFVHDQRPQVTGFLLDALAREEIGLLGLASSPSALSSVVSSAHTEATIRAFFDAFEFPAYGSPSDWYAAYEGKEHLLRKIIASYQEQVIKIYDIVQESNLDLWSIDLSNSDLGNLGAALSSLDRLGIRMPFVVAVPSPGAGLRFGFCFARAQAKEVKHAFSHHFSTTNLEHDPEVAALFIHGPHFGDRYGIASKFVEGLQRAGVAILAMSCTVSSISAIIAELDLDPAIRTLDMIFQRH